MSFRGTQVVPLSQDSESLGHLPAGFIEKIKNQLTHVIENKHWNSILVSWPTLYLFKLSATGEAWTSVKTKSFATSLNETFLLRKRRQIKRNCIPSDFTTSVIELNSIFNRTLWRVSLLENHLITKVESSFYWFMLRADETFGSSVKGILSSLMRVAKSIRCD